MGSTVVVPQALTVVAAADQPSIAVAATLSTTDEQAAAPFSGTIVSDPDHTAFTLSATIIGGASGSVGDFTDASGWTRTVSGSDVTYTQAFADQAGSGSAATAALQALAFQPAAHANAAGTTTQADFTVGFTDTVSNESATAPVALNVTAMDDGPTIQVGAVQTATDVAAAAPFATTNVLDPDEAGMTLSVSFDAAKGDFTNASAWTRAQSGATVTYTMTLPQSANIGTAATAALQALAFQPPAHAGLQGTTSNDSFTLTATDSLTATASSPVAFHVLNTVDAVTATTGPTQSTSDEQAAQPFSGMTVAQPDNTPMTLTVTIPDGASGNVGDFTNASAWTRTVSSSDITYTLQLAAQTNAGAAAQAALQALSFQPAAHVTQPGTITSDSFGVTLEDGTGTIQSLSQPLTVTSSEAAPVLSVAHQPSGSDDQTASFPLSGISVSDPDLTAITLAVTIPGGASGKIGDFTNASAWTRAVSGSDVTYTLQLPAQTGIAAAAQAALQALTFQPAAFVAAPGTVTNDAFLVAATDSSGATSTATTTLPVTAAYVPPTITAAKPAQITDEQAVQPFSATVVSESDDIGGTLTVTIPGGASATVGDFTNASAWTRAVSGNDITYTLHLAAQPNVGAAAQAALHALTFQPTAHQNAPGTLTKGSFTVQFADSSGGTATAQTSLSVLAAQDPVAVSSGTGNTSSGNSGGTASDTGNATYDVETTAPFTGLYRDRRGQPAGDRNRRRGGRCVRRHGRFHQCIRLDAHRVRFRPGLHTDLRSTTECRVGGPGGTPGADLRARAAGPGCDAVRGVLRLDHPGRGRHDTGGEHVPRGHRRAPSLPRPFRRGYEPEGSYIRT